ncbi:MAG: tetratricopeptide repeat protein [Pseudomonadota bacterium]
MHLKTALLSLALAAATALIPLAATAGNSGAYLAARQAGGDSDFEAAAQYFARALISDRNNPELIESTMGSYLSLGDLERAVPLARRMGDLGVESQIASLVLFGDMAKREAWGEILTALENGRSVGPLYDGLLKAWAYVGDGSMSMALETFAAIEEERGTQAFGLYHRALALAAVGDFEGANAIFEGEAGVNLRLTARGVSAHAEVLVQLEDNAGALAKLDEAIERAPDPYLTSLRGRIAAGGLTPFTVVRNAVDGIAEMHFSIATALTGEASDAFTLLYSRIVNSLREDHIEGKILSAELLERMDRYELATVVYDAVPLEHPYFHIAEMGRAEALNQAGRTDAAIEVLTQLGKTHADLPIVHVTLGDTLRRLERFEEATAPYDRAIALLDEPVRPHWSLFFSRGITHERTGNWPQAEADFRKALELQPEQPQVLNYLGYSFVEMQTNLDEALDMIERAVEGEPNSGYITDSLGWVLYRLGRYEEAVVHMERAVELLPVDPIINDHLGDVYWAVGRLREAEFQWLRALSFDPEPDEARRIRRKLDIGLDAVLAEEGAEPLQIANDDG